MQKIKSLIINLGVTYISLTGFFTAKTSWTTIVDTNKEEPIRELTLNNEFPRLFELAGCQESDAEIAENTSGAPFPKARRVTPAKDSDILNLKVSCSSDGDKYMSAVELILYISKIKILP